MRINTNQCLKPLNSLKSANAGKQQGAVIIAAIIFLLVITILGVSAVKMTGMGTQVAGNSMFTMLTYQGAESTLGKTVTPVDLNNIRAASSTVGSYTVLPEDYFPDEQISSGRTLSSTATVTYEDKHPCPMSMAATSTKIGCDIFRVEATTRLLGTGAKATHAAGLALPSRTN